MKVLVVEDDPGSLLYFRDVVHTMNFDCKTAENGKTGLAVFQEYQPQIILSDIRMPEMDGLEFLANIRRTDPDVVVIMVTAFGCEDYTIQALRHHANDYLKKPVRHEDLRAVLRKYAHLLEARSLEQEVLAMVVWRECELEFANEMHLIGKIADHLMRETGNRIPRREKLGVHLGLGELIMNAIEHGNLGVTYEEKTVALDDGFQALESLYQDRMRQNPVGGRKVRVRFSMNAQYAEWIITDDGQGFDWRLLPDPRAEENQLSGHGRGIFLSRMQFDELEFLGKGNQVRVRKYLKPVA